MWRGLLWLLGGCHALPNKVFSHFRAQSTLFGVDCFALSLTKTWQVLPHCCPD
jgi:hypothetical protein